MEAIGLSHWEKCLANSFYVNSGERNFSVGMEYNVYQLFHPVGELEFPKLISSVEPFHSLPQISAW